MCDRFADYVVILGMCVLERVATKKTLLLSVTVIALSDSKL